MVQAHAGIKVLNLSNFIEELSDKEGPQTATMAEDSEGLND
jgi:hypothetical protein